MCSATMSLIGLMSDIVRWWGHDSLVAVGLDAAGSADLRERRAGMDALTRALEEFRG